MSNFVQIFLAVERNVKEKWDGTGEITRTVPFF